MADSLTFYANSRSRLFDHSNEMAAGRAVVQIPVDLANELGGQPAQTAVITFHLMGPGDVATLQKAAIRRVAPKAWSRDAETTKMAHVDFVEEDLPWRYTPKGNGKQIKPWIVLLVGTTEELAVVGDTLQIKDKEAIFGSYDLNRSHLWAHVQADDQGRRLARLLSPRMDPVTHQLAQLAAQREHIAAIVPAYRPDGSSLWDAAHPAGGPDTLPAYYSWRFWTAEAGDFETIAARLRGVAVGDLGRAELRYARLPESEPIEVRGAIAALAAEAPLQQVAMGGKPATLPLATAVAPAAVIEDLDALNDQLTDPRGRPMIGLPVYGRPWIHEPEETDWGRLLNGDPRFRGIAGLGAWLAIEAQEQLVDAARQQIGALDVAAQRVRYLALGLAAARSLWRRHLPAEPEQQLWLFGPTMARMATLAGRSALNSIAGDGRPLPPALFSSAARRLFRPGTGIAKHAQAGAAHRTALFAEANSCLPTPAPSAGHVAELAEIGLPWLLDPEQFPPELRDRIVEVVENHNPMELNLVAEMIYSVLNEFAPNPDNLYERLWVRLQPYNGRDVDEATLTCLVWPFLLPATDNDFDLVASMACNQGQPPERPCHPVRDPGLLAERVRAAIDPHGDSAPALVRIRSTIEGIDIGNLEPPEICIGLDYAAWLLLKDRAREWLLPGVDGLEADAVVAMESNPAFIDALLVGMNTQFMDELKWRHIPVTPNCTPLRWFWGKFDPQSGRRTDDIRGIDLWQDTRLGDNQHQVLRFGDESGNRDLVLVFRTDLFRRYPSTLVYLVKADDDDALKASPVVGDPRFKWPQVRILIADDITGFIFDVKPDELAQFDVVLDEPPAELRFRNDQASGADHSAGFAKATIDPHTRVAVAGDYLKLQGIPA